MKAPDGRYTNGINGFLKMILRYKTELNITHLMVVFDKGRGFRQELYPEYKGTRGSQPAELKEQFPLLEKILNEMGIKVYANDQYEADDLIASLATELESKMRVYTLSNDKDLLQIVSDNIIQIVRSGKDDIYYDSQIFREKYDGLLPEQIIDMKALMGDSSDNIPGVPGIGEKRAKALIKTYGSIEALYENLSSLSKAMREKLEEGRESGFLSKRLTILVKELSVLNQIDEVSYTCSDLSRSQFLNLCNELGLHTIINDVKRGKYSL
jgi:DNA polymerase-1